MKPYVVLEKKVGETPLACLEAYRLQHPELTQIPMAYAGRLDPMASGKLLVLQGDECKVQEKYHGLDKEYEFEILFGVSSDTQDVLGIVQKHGGSNVARAKLEEVAQCFIGQIELPYPLFSSKTVKGKPLHTWTLEGRVNEITIPTKRSQIHSLEVLEMQTLTQKEVYAYAAEKIETIPKVTDARKAIGNDFRRTEVRASWKAFAETQNENYTVAKIRCVCSSGTYMRSLSEAIAAKLGTTGLAFSIHRTIIGSYLPLPFGLGFWRKKY